VEQGYDLRARMQQIEEEYRMTGNVTRNEAQLMARQVMHTAEEREQLARTLDRVLRAEDRERFCTGARNTKANRELIESVKRLRQRANEFLRDLEV